MFNLKLPMKKRYAEAVHNIEVLRGLLAEIDSGFIIQAKQLYHDREEITVHVYNKFWVSKLADRPKSSSKQHREQGWKAMAKNRTATSGFLCLGHQKR